MLSVIILNVALVVLLNTIMLSVAFFIVMLSVNMLSAINQNAVMPSAINQNAVVLSGSFLMVC
jgi:hypothetical protein